jgi:hypothetical protein
MNWDPFQREVLDALGLVAYRVVGDEPADPPRDALSLALLRAAARSPDAADAARLCREWGAPARLHDAVAKRALWPRLRALRRIPR